MKWEAGLRWAFGMLGVDMIELAALLHITLVDRDRARLTDGIVDGVEIYLIFIIMTLLMQLLGIVLVQKGFYRTGAVLQIVSSAPHAVKVEGLIGVMGGIEAWRFGQKARKVDDTLSVKEAENPV